MLRPFEVFDEVMQDDTYPTFVHTLEDDDSPLDISLPTTTIEVKMLKPSSSVPVTLPGSQVFKTGNPGEIFWKFIPGDINVPGIYKIQIRAYFSGRPYTSIEDLYLKVKAKLG